MPTMGVYAIRNKVNGNQYIGASENIERRWILHRNRLRAGMHRNSALQTDWQSIGEAAFTLAVIEETASVDAARQAELRYLSTESPLYNVLNVPKENKPHRVTSEQAAERIRFREAAKRLGISENTLRSRITEHKITIYFNPRDKRERLLDRDELESKLGIPLDEQEPPA